MKYRSFATLAAAFAAIMIASTPATVAAAKTEAAHQVSATDVQAKSTELYAQAGGYSNDARLVRLDAQALPATAEVHGSKSEDQAPLNLLALVIAGFAVMGSLAFRRSPSK